MRKDREPGDELVSVHWGAVGSNGKNTTSCAPRTGVTEYFVHLKIFFIIYLKILHSFSNGLCYTEITIRNAQKILFKKNPLEIVSRVAHHSTGLFLFIKIFLFFLGKM